ncbi:hypothetical protein G7Y89_g4723 [Cudoniella acicularis]|uniref:Insecticide toxin TcdB middle/N-terminal domain-containing protein n=1 Tax=Cudoniella acicularis TaxID=354080 RepID=A0A8H4W4F7_9HELO|nr:hypothetical protein G7Y89_g4723 [Cudoniella acicularis]
MVESFLEEPSQKAASPFAEQQYSLPRPKAGGAHASLSESLTFEPTRGSCNLAIPITATPARRGFEPQLQLRYDSGAGNGPFGIGWTLDLPKIVRQTSRGVPTYGESDVFIHHANGDPVELVPSNVSLEREVRETRYQIRQFKPQLLKSPFCLEQWTNKADPDDVHWRHISAENVTTLFGLSSSSRIMSAETKGIFSWLASQKFDCYGNVINFSYKSEDSIAGDEESPHQSNNKYIERVQYGNCVPFQRDQIGKCFDFHFEIFFVYSQLSPCEAARSLQEKGDPNRTWLCRQDAFSSFRSGFEIRTRRLCRQILMLHHFDEEPSMQTSDEDSECLIGSFSLEYLEHPGGTQMKRFVETGHCGLVTKSKPAIEFDYTTSMLNLDTTIKSVLLGSFLSFEQLKWIDMDGTGLPSLAIKNENGYFIRENISTISDTPIFTDWVRMADFPALEKGKLSDFDNDGCIEYVDWRHGFFKKRGAKWENFKQFQQVPNYDPESSHFRFIDLTGNGTGDVLVADKETYLWFQSLREKGFTGPKATRFANQEPSLRPSLQPTHLHELLYLADMTGDGLLDLVCIRNGSISYWPNVGHGAFGEQILMRNSPWFESNDEFSHSRLVLHDLDGSGTADLVYLPSAGGLQVYLNESGNAWTAASEYPQFPRCHQNDMPQLIDLYGNGTMCAVLFDRATGGLFILDFFSSKKPRMLSMFRNGFGLETEFQYTSSSQLQKRDALAGQQWRLTLPFSIQCLTQASTYDKILDARTTRHFQYRDGYYDDIRREFNGFGLVEEWNGPKDAFTTLHTTSWYFTGSVDQYSDLVLEHQPDQVPFTLPSGLSGSISREALRAAKGNLIRKHSAPASVSCDGKLLESEHRSYQIQLQSEVSGHESFRVNLVQATTSTFELETVPRIHQYCAYEIDEYGNALTWADIYFGSQSSTCTGQASTKVLLTQREVTKLLDLDDDFRAPVESERRQAGALSAMIHEPHQHISFEYLQQQAGKMTLLNTTRQFFRSDDLRGILSLGHNGILGLFAYESRLVFDAEDVQNLKRGLGNTVQADLEESGYVEGDNGCWYAQSGRWFFEPQRSDISTQIWLGSELEAARKAFFTPCFHVDQFGNHQIFQYDRYWLCKARLELPLGMKSSAEYNYRNMMMSLFINENENTWSYEYDALGHVSREFEGRITSNTELKENNLPSDFANIELNAKDLLRGGIAYNFHDYESKPYKSIHIAKFKHSESISISYLDGAGKLCQERSFVAQNKWLVSSSRALALDSSIQHDFDPFYDLSPDFGLPPPGTNFLTTIFDSLHRPTLIVRQDEAWSWVENKAWSRTEHSFGDTATLTPPQNFGPALTESNRSLKSSQEVRNLTYSYTPRIICFDCQGQDIQLVSQIGQNNAISTRKIRSVDGRVQEVYNSKGNCVLLNSYSKSGDVYFTKSADAGEQYVLRSVDGLMTRLFKGDVRRTSFRFDKLRRPTDDLENDQIFVSRAYYEDRSPANAFGRVRMVKNSAITTSFLGYDVRGNPEKIEQQIHLPGAEGLTNVLPKFKIGKEYDLDSRVLLSRSPNGKELLYDYDPKGRLRNVGGLAKIDYTPTGHLLDLSFQNGCKTTFEYSKTNWLKRKVTTTRGEHIQECLYQRDIMGRITELSDDAVSNFKIEQQEPLLWTYDYDGHGRLLSGTTHSLPNGETSLIINSLKNQGRSIPTLTRKQENYAYDSEGNITSLEHNDSGDLTQLEYGYDGASNKLQSVSKDNQSFHTVKYENRDGALGLPSQLNKLRLQWNSEQKLFKVVDEDTMSETSYLYDTLGMRIAKVTHHEDRAMIYVYLEEFESTFIYENGKLSKLDDTISVRTGDTLLGRIGGQKGITTILADHLSSISLELDAQGQVTTYRSYAPYGEISFELRLEEQSSNTQHDSSTVGFTGNKHDIETNFDYSKNRYLASQLKRWLSPDPSGLAGGSTNLYCYADADPINKVDHDGLFPLWVTHEGTGEKFGALHMLSKLGNTLMMTAVYWKASNMLDRGSNSPNAAVNIVSALTTGALMKKVENSAQQAYGYVNQEHPGSASDFATMVGLAGTALRWGAMTPMQRLCATVVSNLGGFQDLGGSGPNVVRGQEATAIQSMKAQNPSQLEHDYSNGNYYHVSVLRDNIFTVPVKMSDQAKKEQFNTDPHSMVRLDAQVKHKF